MLTSILRYVLVLILSFAAGSGLSAEPTVSPKESEEAQIRSAVNHVLDANKNFVTQHSKDYFRPFLEGQKPKATVVTCADSRVHSHALDPHPDGDLFMVRDIGNQVATAEGSIEYGIHHLHTPLLMIVGHSMCGAVKAAMGDYSALGPAIKHDLESIHITKGDASDPILLMNAIEQNVDGQVDLAVKKFAEEIHAGKLIVIGAVYDFRNDYRHGFGRLILVNVNGDQDENSIRKRVGFSKHAIAE